MYEQGEESHGRDLTIRIKKLGIWDVVANPETSQKETGANKAKRMSGGMESEGGNLYFWRESHLL